MSVIKISENLEIKGSNASNPGELILSNGSNDITIKPNTTLSSNINFFLPNNSGTSGQLVTKTASGTNWSSQQTNNPEIWIVKDVKPSGTDGGTFTSGSFQTRVLNTLVKPVGTGTSVQLAVSPAGLNQLLIATGVYKIFGFCYAHNVDKHKAILYNVSDGVLAVDGSSERIGANTNESVLDSFFTVTSGPKIFEVQHHANTTQATDGFGKASSFGVEEVYTQMYITKIAES